MAKTKTKWVCQSCGYESFSYLGRCPDCGNFATFCEEVVQDAPQLKTNSAPSLILNNELKVQKINEVENDEKIRLKTGMEEFDRVLGGGFVEGSLVLLAGDPGIGKSTLVLQACRNLCSEKSNSPAIRALYVCAEESPRQVKLRAMRLGVKSECLYVTSQNCLEEVIKQIDEINPKFLVVDSIQAVFSSQITSSCGSVSQIRECTNILMRIAKQKNITTVIIGHVTKEGNIAGPKVLEHMVDCVINFEGDRYKSCRILRSIKNRFGATSEVGVFNMDDDGLSEVLNPSELFLDSLDVNNCGCSVIASVEGTRVLLLEIQSLTGSTPYPNPRRVARGIEYNRLLQILAVLEKRVGLNLSKQDVYINVIGGIDIIEPAADLGAALAIVSCARDIAIKKKTVIIGEIGLSGEIRAVDNLEKRLKEAQKLGFEYAIVPAVNSNAAQKLNKLDIKILQVNKLTDAIIQAFKE